MASSFEKAFNPAFQSAMQSIAEEKRDKRQEALLDKRMLEQRAYTKEQQLDQRVYNEKEQEKQREINAELVKDRRDYENMQITKNEALNLGATQEILDTYMQGQNEYALGLLMDELRKENKAGVAASQAGKPFVPVMNPGVAEDDFRTSGEAFTKPSPGFERGYANDQAKLAEREVLNKSALNFDAQRREANKAADLTEVADVASMYSGVPGIDFSGANNRVEALQAVTQNQNAANFAAEQMRYGVPTILNYAIGENVPTANMQFELAEAKEREAVNKLDAANQRDIQQRNASHVRMMLDVVPKEFLKDIVDDKGIVTDKGNRYLLDNVAYVPPTQIFNPITGKSEGMSAGHYKWIPQVKILPDKTPLGGGDGAGVVPGGVPGVKPDGKIPIEQSLKNIINQRGAQQNLSSKEIANLTRIIEETGKTPSSKLDHYTPLVPGPFGGGSSGGDAVLMRPYKKIEDVQGSFKEAALLGLENQEHSILEKIKKDNIEWSKYNKTLPNNMSSVQQKKYNDELEKYNNTIDQHNFNLKKINQDRESIGFFKNKNKPVLPQVPYQHKNPAIKYQK